MRPKITFVLLIAAALAPPAYGQSPAAPANESDERINTLITALRSDDAKLQFAAAKALGQMQSKRAVDALLALAQDSNAQLRRTAVAALAEGGNPRARDLFITALGDPDRSVRGEAAMGLCKFSDKRTIAVLAELCTTYQQTMSRTSRGWPPIDATLIKSGDTVVPHLATMLTRDAVRQSKAIQLLTKINTPLAIKATHTATRNKNWRVRAAVITALGRMTDRPWARLIDLTSDDNATVRLAAIQGLTRAKNYRSQAKFPEDIPVELRPRAVDALIRALKYRDMAVRTQAAKALIPVNDPRLVAPYCALLRTGDLHARGYAARGLDVVADKTAVPTLIAAMNDTSSTVTYMAGRALARLGAEASLRGLLLAARHERTEVAHPAVDAIAALNTPPARAALVGLLRDGSTLTKIHVMASPTALEIPTAPAAIARLTAPGTDQRLRQAAVEALAGMKGPATTALRMKPLTIAFNDKRPELRLAALVGLTNIDSDQSWQAILARVEYESDGPTLEAIRLHFTSTKRDVGLKGLCAILTRSMQLRRQNVRNAYQSKPVALSIITTLAETKDPQATAALCHALTEETDVGVRTVVALKLGMKAEPASIAALLKAMDDPEYVVRRGAIAALGRIDDKSTIEPIAAAMGHPGTYDIAAYVLARSDPQRAYRWYLTVLGQDLALEVRRACRTDIVDALIAVLAYGPDAVRLPAVRHLGRLRDPRAVGPLLDTLKSEVPDVRAAAASALENLKTDGVAMVRLRHSSATKPANGASPIDALLAQYAMIRKQADPTTASARWKQVVQQAWPNVLSQPQAFATADDDKRFLLIRRVFGNLTTEQRAALLKNLTKHYSKASKALAALDRVQFVSLGLVLRDLRMPKRQIALLALDWAHSSSRWVPPCPRVGGWTYHYSDDIRLNSMLQPLLEKKGYAHILNADSAPCPAVVKAYAWMRRDDATWLEYLRNKSLDESQTDDQAAGWLLARAYAQTLHDCKYITYKRTMGGYKVRKFVADAAATCKSESLRFTCTEWIGLAMVGYPADSRERYIKEVDPHPPAYTDPAVLKRLAQMKAHFQAKDARAKWADLYRSKRRKVADYERTIKSTDQRLPSPNRFPASIRSDPERSAKYTESLKRHRASAQTNVVQARAELELMETMKGNW